MEKNRWMLLTHCEHEDIDVEYEKVGVFHCRVKNCRLWFFAENDVKSSSKRCRFRLPVIRCYDVTDSANTITRINWSCGHSRHSVDQVFGLWLVNSVHMYYLEVMTKIASFFRPCIKFFALLQNDWLLGNHKNLNFSTALSSRSKWLIFSRFNYMSEITKSTPCCSIIFQDQLKSVHKLSRNTIFHICLFIIQCCWFIHFSIITSSNHSNSSNLHWSHLAKVTKFSNSISTRWC